jgi:hypothetical protein
VVYLKVGVLSQYLPGGHEEKSSQGTNTGYQAEIQTQDLMNTKLKC